MPVKQELMFHQCKSCPRGDNCVCEEECSMDERANCEIFQNLEAGVPAKRVKKPVERVKSERHLKWYQTQWWSGAIAGFYSGAIVGVAISYILFLIAKAVVTSITGV